MVILTSGTTGAAEGRADRPRVRPRAARLVPERRADRRGLDLPDPGSAVPRARPRPVHDRDGARVHGGAPADVRRRGDARPDRASSHRGDGGGPDDAESHHGPGSGHPPPVRNQLAAGGGVQRLRARRAAGALVHGRVRAGALQPVRLHRGGLGDDRDPGGPARGTRHRGPATAPHAPRDPRRGGASAAARLHRSHIRRPTRCCSRATRTRARTASA